MPIIFYPLNIMKKYLFALTYNDIFTIGYANSNKRIKKKEYKKRNIKEVYDEINIPKIIINAKEKYTNRQERKLNNIEIYEIFKERILPNINDFPKKYNLNTITNYIIDQLIICSKIIIDYHLELKKDIEGKIINKSNYKQISAFLCAKLNELLYINNSKIEIVITDSGLFIINENEYIQLIVKTYHNILSFNEPKDFRKLKAITHRKKIDYKIIVNDPEDRVLKNRNNISNLSNCIIIGKNYIIK